MCVKPCWETIRQYILIMHVIRTCIFWAMFTWSSSRSSLGRPQGGIKSLGGHRCRTPNAIYIYIYIYIYVKFEYVGCRVYSYELCTITCWHIFARMCTQIRIHMHMNMHFVDWHIWIKHRNHHTSTNQCIHACRLSRMRLSTSDAHISCKFDFEND